MSGWTQEEVEVVTAAVRAAPSDYDTQPWVLELHDDHDAFLFERRDRVVPHRYDPLGRDRLISCGAVLENLVLAMRVLGRPPELTLLPEPERPDELARLRSTIRREPSDVDIERYAAVAMRGGHLHPFADVPVASATRDALVAAAGIDGVEVRPVRGEEIDVLAKVLDHAALVLKSDRVYHQELSAWTATVPDPSPGEGVAERLRREVLLLVQTPDDGRLDHVRAGLAVQATWLAAVAAGLVGSVLTQPLHVHEVRAGLIEGLELPGFPQAFLRFGNSTGRPGTPVDAEEDPS